jgi:hypothetical protein
MMKYSPYAMNAKRGDLTQREILVMDSRIAGVTVKTLASLHRVTEYRIRQVTKKAKAKIVDKITTRLVTQK